MAKPKKLKAPAAQGVLQSRDEVVDAIAEIGRRTRERVRIEAEMGDDLALIRERYEGEAQPHAERCRELILGVQAWVEAHRDELTQGGKTKTIRFPSGEVKWRITPPSIAVRGTEAVIAWLRIQTLLRFIRIKEEVNKEALLNEPDVANGVPGVTISQREEFVVEPFEVALADAGGV